MDEVWKAITDRLKLFKEHWATYSVVGTALLYLLGYLITRFQLTMLGVGTGLDVLEEQYFYAGARFAVYLLGAALPSLVLILLLVGLLAWVFLKLLRFAAGPTRSAILAQRWSN